MKKKPFYITTTLPYVNAEAHLGHALEFVRADIIARWKKLEGLEVFFNTGADEHGQKIALAAEKSGKSPQEYVDEYSKKLQSLQKTLGLSDDIHFIRTTDKNHIKAAQEFWKRVAKNGFIYKKNYKSKYCVGCELEKTDSELENGRCPIHPNLEIEIIDEENYFFRFSSFKGYLLDFYGKNPNFVIPDFRYNEAKAFVERGLSDFSISRLKSKMSWGIPVPDDGDQVMYVWFDALVSYISTLGWPKDEKNFEKFWTNGTPTQYCGKDNTRFQAVMWQAMLMAANLPPTNTVVVDGFITGEAGVKMAKSLGNVVSPIELVNEYGTDALRYFLAREVSPFEDSPFTIERFKAAYNSGLANGLGNLVSRLMTLSEKYIKNRVLELILEDTEKRSENVFITDAFNSFNINLVCEMIWDGIAKLDKKISDGEVFKVVKSDNAKAIQMLTEYLFDLGIIAYQLKPILPTTSEEIISVMKSNRKPPAPLFARKD